MDNDEYRTEMDLVVNFARMIQLLPVDELTQALGKVETLAPIFEPTAYLRGGADNLQDQRALLTAVAAVKQAMDRIDERAAKRART